MNAALTFVDKFSKLCESFKSKHARNKDTPSYDNGRTWSNSDEPIVKQNKNIPWKMKMFQIPEIGSLTWSEVSYEAILKSRTLIKLLKVIKAFQEDYRNLIIIVFIADSAALSTNTVRKKWCHFPWCRNCHYKLAVQLIFIANNVNELQLFLPTMLPV